MNLKQSRRRREQAGQTIVLFAIGLVAMISMVGLVIDGGNAYVQQRRTQNGIDAAAEAGAVQLARRLLGLPGTDAEWDQRVVDLVAATATSNELTTVGTPSYVDHDGNVLGPVGTGTIPADTQGVQVQGTRDFRTYFAGVIGMNQITAGASATAITGYAEASGVGGLIPLTIPILLTQCETGGGSNRLFHPNNGEPWPVGPQNVVALPLCSNGPGNVGWIDWTPPGGGASEVAASIRNPNNPPIRTPRWYFITETGSITSLDDDMDTWEGKDITIPIFHVQADNPATPADESEIGTCSGTPGGAQNSLADCPTGDIGFTGAQGWYFLVSFGEFHLLHSYIQGNHQTECNDASSLASVAGNGTNPVNNCLIGYFKSPVVAGEFEVGVGSTAPTPFTPVSVQLIR